MARRGAGRRWPTLPGLPAALALSAIAMLPFAFTPIPPLTDVPGHIGRFAVQTAPADSPLFGYFAFHWALVLNLAADLIVQLLHPCVALIPLTRAICAATAALTTLGILMVARAANPRGAGAVPWALLFVFNFPFLWGFINFALTLALALLVFAAWIAAPRPGRRALLAILAPPILLIGHGVAGAVFVGMVVAWEAGEAIRPRSGPVAGALVGRLPRLAPLLLSALATIGVWQAIGGHDHGATLWLPMRKVEAVVMMVRDQNRLLDEGTVAACVALWVIGHRAGARLRGGALATVMFLVALFVATPSLLSGSDRLDTRLAPVIPMVAFALVDWSAVDARRRRVVLVAGFALLAIRFGVTTASFAGYGERYRAELAALDHVRRGARVLNLSHVDCPEVAWRSERLEHLSNLATPLRGAWVNSHWSISGIQLLAVRYVPSAAYARDPSHLVWPDRCIDRRLPFGARDRHDLAETLPALPLRGADYLWLVGERLPGGDRYPVLTRVWADDISELYAVDPHPR